MTQKELRLSPLQRFWKLLQVDRQEIGHIYIYAIFNGLVNLSVPIGIQAIIGFIQGGEVSASWTVLVAFVIAGVGLTGWLQMKQLRIAENLQRKIFTRASFEFAFRIPRIKMAALKRYYAPELVNRFFDTLSVQKGLSKILMDFSTASFQVFFGLVLLSIYHPFFILFSLMLVILVYVIFRLTSDKGLRASIRESHAKYEVAHWLEELARAMGTFKMAGDSKLPLEKVDEGTTDYLDSRARHFKVLYNQYGFLVLFRIIVAAGLLVAGSILVFKQQMNVGQFVAAEILILMILASVEKLILSLDTIYDVLTSLEKIGQVTDLPLEEQEGQNLEDLCDNGPLNIEMSKVDFTYTGSKLPTLNDVSLNLQQNKKYLVTGLSGAGKTTVLQLIAGLYTPDEGHILFNGTPAGSIRLESLRSAIGSYTDEEVLFRGSICDNISMGRSGITQAEVRWAVQKVGLSPFIKELDKGLDTDVAPEGKGLPRGVIQKILLARSVVCKPRFVLLEDQLNALSARERDEIMDFLTAPDTPWALVVSSQDLAWAGRVDEVIVLDHGTVAVSGPYKEIKGNSYFTKPA